MLYNREMLSQLAQYQNTAFFLLKLVVAIIFLRHGLPKLKLRNWMLAIGIIETLSALALVVGTYVQIAAFLLACVMIGAIYLKITKWKVPFSAHDKSGWEFDLILLAANLFILTMH